MDNMRGISGFQHTSRILERTLDALGLRHRVTAHNIANVNTPGYQPRQVSFEESLGQAMRIDAQNRQANVASVNSATNFRINIAQQPVTMLRADGNGVDVDKEMVTIAKTVIAYNAITTLTSRLYSRVRLAVKEGRN
jgi:flagellar basal-body rod protein FlgB